jgi:malonyl-CoA O-methyltransferase
MLQAPDLDPKAVVRQFDRRAATFFDNDYLLREIERRMFERLDVVKLAPAQIVDLGCGLGAGVLELSRRYPLAQTVGLDASPAMLAAAKQRSQAPAQGVFSKFLKSMGAGPSARFRFEEADLARLPFAAESVDLLWSNLAFHWLTSPQECLSEMVRVAKPGALLMFSTLGVDTLREVRTAAGAAVDLMPFRDMHDWGDALVAAGFAEPVMDMERITLSFTEPQKVLTDLHRLGGNALRGRRPGLSPRSLRDDLIRKLQFLKGSKRELTLTFEVIYGHAWVPAKKKRRDGLATIEFLPKRPQADG